MSALPPKADINDGCDKCLLMTQSGHSGRHASWGTLKVSESQKRTGRLTIIGAIFNRLQDLFFRLMVREDDGGELFCSVCSEAPAVGVFSSRFGPVSHAACETCRDEGAESLFMTCFHIYRAGGPKIAKERFAEARSFHEGKYIGLEEILAHYPDFEDEF